MNALTPPSRGVRHPGSGRGFAYFPRGDIFHELRYIGNKTRLLGFLESVLAAHGVEGGHAVDAFAGTASVGRFLKARGFRVSSCDIMTYSYVFQRSYVQLDAAPTFARLLPLIDTTATRSEGTSALQRVLTHLEQHVCPRRSVITREFASAHPDGAGARMYFTDANARRIDAIREQLDEWSAAELLSSDELHVLLAALLEATDAVANTTGVYAAWVKSWQSNARRPLRLKEPELVLDTGLQHRAIQGDVNEVIADLGRIDLLYLDPPYNSRQYSGYYHVPELIATGWSSGAPHLRGKTGLIPDSDKRSEWSRRGQCVAALHELLERASARHVLLSYNSEGIIPEDEIVRALRERGVPGTFTIHEKEYARYRSDRDRTDRRYKASRVREKVYFVELR